MSLPLPLDGVRVLAVEQYGAGPWGTLYLADLGAEIVKIEPPGAGDMARGVGPHRLGPGDSQFFQTFNRNKRSLTLDLKHPEGRALFRRLAATADAVLNNLRGDQPDRLGLTHAALRDVKPALVCVHLSGYGRTGERRGWPGYDYLMQAEAGYFALTGEPGSPPARMGLSIVDYMAGLTAAFALLAALLSAGRTGQGRDVDVSLFDVAMHQLSYPATWYLNAGEVTERRPRSGHPSIVPVELFPTADGWIFVMCVAAHFWPALARTLGRPELADDPRFADHDARRRNRDALVALLDPVFRTRTTAEWMTEFAGTVPAAPVYDLPAALDNPFAAQRGLIQTVMHPTAGPLRLLANPIRPAGAELPGRPAPALGADTEALLDELGCDGREIARLRAAGVV